MKNERNNDNLWKDRVAEGVEEATVYQQKMATNSSNMKNGFAIYLDLSSLSIVHKLVVAIKKKLSVNVLKG